MQTRTCALRKIFHHVHRAERNSEYLLTINTDDYIEQVSFNCSSLHTQKHSAKLSQPVSKQHNVICYTFVIIYIFLFSIGYVCRALSALRDEPDDDATISHAKKDYVSSTAVLLAKF